MYQIELTTWYQEKPKNYYKEIYKNLKFYSIESAAIYLGKNIKEITNEFPVISIKIIPKYEK